MHSRFNVNFQVYPLYDFQNNLMSHSPLPTEALPRVYCVFANRLGTIPNHLKYGIELTLHHIQYSKYKVVVKIKFFRFFKIVSVQV
jgi:hypothetical protein